MQDYMLSPDEAAIYLNVSVRTLKNWRVQKNGLRFYKPTNKLIYYAKEDLDTWIKESKYD